ncbi:protein of unknown function [Cupriavidus taiwanensis]|uniref:Uncharacterized protein n=1 Tax=Cupriavidus taiwanensis TaxID=164546 RepID=A0A375IHI2_9BURK|nr:protein of unknown function [Cupriavidus taiwanensis]
MSAGTLAGRAPIRGRARRLAMSQVPQTPVVPGRAGTIKLAVFAETVEPEEIPHHAKTPAKPDPHCRRRRPGGVRCACAGAGPGRRRRRHQ